MVNKIKAQVNWQLIENKTTFVAFITENYDIYKLRVFTL